MTSSAAYEPSRALGEFDIRQLRLFRDMAERHLVGALGQIGSSQRLTAAADPNQFITDEMIAEFLDLAFTGWADGYNLVLSLLPNQLPEALLTGIVSSAVKDAASHYHDILNSLIGDKAFKTLSEPILGEFIKGAQVQYGDIRPLLVTLGGGSPDSEINMVGGIATGRTMQDWLGQNGVAATASKIWLYGYEDEPRRTFNGHLQMDGLVFDSWDDPGLEIAPQDYWLRRTHYAPGDHWGCGCVVAPYIPNFGDDYTLDV